jgi:pyrroloquinoline quinone biosynthesis protein B
MPRMAAYLSGHGPWSQLVRYGNIRLSPLTADSTIVLNERLRVTPFLVPHRPEFSEVVGYRIDGPSRSVLFIPDIDSWTEWDNWGVHLEDMLATVDVAYLDATFFADGEIPGRDMSGFPHPFIATTMDRLATASDTTRAKVRFIHLNHTNPALITGSPEWQSVISAGFHVAETGETMGL